MTLSARRFGIAAIIGLMMLSLTPSSAQAFCLWGYGNSCYTRSSSFKPIAGAALGINQEITPDTQVPPDGAVHLGNLRAQEKAVGLGVLGVIAIITAVNSGGGS
ncbi:MAG: hypothetical protein ACSHWY_02930 [Octadecabacter sp.]